MRARVKTAKLVSSTTFSKRKNPSCMDSIIVKEVTTIERIERKDKVAKVKYNNVWSKIQAEASKL